MIGYLSGSDLIPIFFSKGINEIGAEEDGDDARAVIAMINYGISRVIIEKYSMQVEMYHRCYRLMA